MSAVTTLFWIALILFITTLIAYLADWWEQREKRKRIQRLIERREYLDSLEPKPWR